MSSRTASDNHGAFEQYCEAIFELHEDDLDVIQARIADRLDVSRPAVSEMIKRMEADGLVQLGSNITLTSKGTELAEQIVRRHRLAERFLTDVLKLSWADAHREAGKWEHVISQPVEDAMAHLAKKENPPRFSLDKARAELAMKTVDGGFVLTRDPDQKNTQSQAPGAPMPKFTNVDSWDALAEIKCPVTFIRGSRSDRNNPEHYARIARDFPHIRVETIDSRHDLAFEAPDELIAIVNRVMIDQPDSERSRAFA